MRSINPVNIYEKPLIQDGLADVIEIFRKRYERHYRRYCIKSLHNSMTFGWELPRRKSGSKLGLKKRIKLARENGLYI